MVRGSTKRVLGGHMKKLLVGGTLALVTVVGAAVPAFAHECYNPTKTPGAGSKLTVVLAPNPEADPVAVIPTGPGKGYGGFTQLDTSQVDTSQLPPGTQLPATIDVHTFGNGAHGPKDGTVGTGGEKAGAKGCDGKGIDYIESCFAPAP
jgi:hypothetical protein